MLPHQTRSLMDREFAGIRDNLLRMGDLLDRALDRAMRALQTNDLELARQVVSEDEAVNSLRYQIEEQCLTLLATQAPAAGDLRTVFSVVNMVSDLERIGDHAAGLAKSVIRASDSPLLVMPPAFAEMAATARRMLRGCLEAFLARDADAARAVAVLDDELDVRYKATFKDMLQVMATQPDAVKSATYMLLAGYGLERIGDRITNITERIVFMSTGDVKELNP